MGAFGALVVVVIDSLRWWRNGKATAASEVRNMEATDPEPKVGTKEFNRKVVVSLFPTNMEGAYGNLSRTAGGCVVVSGIWALLSTTSDMELSLVAGGGGRNEAVELRYPVTGSEDRRKADSSRAILARSTNILTDRFPFRFRSIGFSSLLASRRSGAAEAAPPGPIILCDSSSSETDNILRELRNSFRTKFRRLSHCQRSVLHFVRAERKGLSLLNQS